MIMRVVVLFGALWAMAVPVLAAEPEQPTKAQTEAVQAAMARAIGAPPDSVRATPLPDIFEAAYGTQIFYVSADGRYVMEGQLLDIQARRSLTDERRTERRGEMVKGLNEAEMIVFGPTQPKHTVTVFTDVNCTYCRRMHQDIAEYNKRGIAVRYLAFSAPGAPSFDKMVSVWCAKDPKAAMTAAKADKSVSAQTCDNPVERQGQLGAALGVTGTPSIILANGVMLPGFVPPAQLEDILEGRIKP